MHIKILKALSIHDIKEYKHPKEIDVVISVGGFYGFYVIGVHKILKKLEKEGKIIIKRYAGASVGAICSVLMACNVPEEMIVEMYDSLLFKKRYLFELRKLLYNLLPINAYEICSGKVYINATEITPFGFKKTIFSTYQNNDELLDACMASSNLPFYVSPNLFYKFKNKYYIDGCFTNVLPIFHDKKNEQLLIKLYKIKYHSPYSIYPNDTSIEGLIVKGGVEMHKFLKFSPSYIKTLEWFDEEKLKIKRKKRIKKIIVCSMVLGFFYLLKNRYFSRESLDSIRSNLIYFSIFERPSTDNYISKLFFNLKY